MAILPKKSIYRGYDITNSGIVVRIWLNGKMVEFGAMTEEEAHKWIDDHKKSQPKK